MLAVVAADQRLTMAASFPGPATRRHARRLRTTIQNKIESLLSVVATRWSFPDRILNYLAFQANLRGDYEVALRLWAQLARRHPDWTIGYAGRTTALRRLQRWDEAADLLRESLERFPDDEALTVELGWLLFERRDLEPALTVWRRVIDLAPHRPESHVGYATTLRHMRHFDEADAVLEAATAQFPDASFVWTNHAVTADERGDREEALRRWQAVFERFRHEAIAYAGLGAALKMLGRMAEADALMQQGMQLFPDDPNLAINHAWVAVARGDWPEAVRRWTALRARWPDDPVIRRGLTETLMRSQLAAADAAADHVHVGTVDHASDEHARLHALMMRFESVGENCELGFVQRHFGSEPLGLFRWAGIGYTALLEALDSQFAGIGDAEYTEIVVNATSHEYHSEDSRYGMSMHTFFMEGSAAPDVIKARVCRRLVYLKDKLLNDLRDGDKIFVFNSPTPLSDAELRRLHAALLAYGPVLLLHVAPHADQAVGSVVPVDTHLWRGSLGRTGNDGRMWNIEFDAWLAICQAANRLQAEQGRAVASAPA